MKDKRYLNQDIKIMLMTCKDKKVRYGMNKILRYFRKRLFEAENKEQEIIAIDSELRSMSMINCGKRIKKDID